MDRRSLTTLGFLYDGDGNRLARIVNGTFTTHTLDVGLSLPEVLVEHQSTNPQSTRYLHLPHSITTDDGAWTYSAAVHSAIAPGCWRKRPGQRAPAPGRERAGFVLGLRRERSTERLSPKDGGGQRLPAFWACPE